MKLIITLLLILVAIGLFFGFIDPTYERVKVLAAEEARFDDALNRSRELIAIRDELLSRYNTFPMTGLTRLEKLLPNTVDNVRLILDIDSTAARYGIVLKNISINEVSTEEGTDFASQGQETYGSIRLGFTVTAPYESFKQFLIDLENSLRLVDVVALGFRSGDADFNEYEVTIETYWLR